jgi:hypothetical protein
MGKRKCMFNVNLQQQYKFLKLCNDSNNEHVYCIGHLLQLREFFSIMGNIWSAERGRLSVSTFKHLLNVKINSELSCCEFYYVIKANKPFLKEVMSSEEYN